MIAACEALMMSVLGAVGATGADPQAGAVMPVVDGATPNASAWRSHVSVWGYGALYLTLAIAGNVGSALAGGGEMGVYSLNRARLRLRAAGSGPGSGAAVILSRELERPARLLATLLVSYNLLAYAGSVGITGLLEGRGYSDAMIIVLNTVLIGPLLFVFAETLPKELFRRDADRLTYWLAGPMRWARWLLTWTLVLPLVQATARGLSILVRGGDESAIPTARERIGAMLQEGARGGAISAEQLGLLDRALALRDTTVGDEMTTWAKTAKIEAEMPTAQVVATLAARPFSRLPLVNAKGGVLGVVEALDLLLTPGAAPTAVAKPALRLEETLSVREGLARMAHAGASLALVVGEGRDAPLGIVTTKDLVEPVTGELQAF